MADGGGGAAAQKEQGNEQFKSGSYLKAAALYTQAIKLDPGNPILYRSSEPLDISIHEVLPRIIHRNCLSDKWTADGSLILPLLHDPCTSRCAGRIACQIL